MLQHQLQSAYDYITRNIGLSPARRLVGEHGRAVVSIFTAMGLVGAQFIAAGTAVADDLASPGTSGGDPHIAIDTTWYGTSTGVRYADLNATLAPFGSIYASGFRFRFSGYWVGYNYVFNDSPRTLAWGDILAGSWQAGYGIVTERVSAIGLLGPAINENQNAGVRTTTTGVLGTVQVSVTPWDESLVYGSAKYSTLNRNYELQGKIGQKIFGGPYLGVEAKLIGLLVQPQTLVSQQSLGVHLSAIKVGRAYFGLSGGYINDNQIGSGAYISSSMYVAF